jgi:hypothetical protein
METFMKRWKACALPRMEWYVNRNLDQKWEIDNNLCLRRQLWIINDNDGVKKNSGESMLLSIDDFVVGGEDECATFSLICIVLWLVKLLVKAFTFGLVQL